MHPEFAGDVEGETASESAFLIPPRGSRKIGCPLITWKGNAKDPNVLLNFDYDGVLVDSLDDILSKVTQAQRILGLGRPPTKADFQTLTDLTFKGLAKVLEIPKGKIAQFASTVFELLTSDSDDPAMFPGIVEVIQTLGRRHDLAIITSNLERTVQRVLAKNHLSESFLLISDGAQAGTKSERIARAQARFGARAAETFMIGDAVSDIREGKIAGVKTIAVSWGFQLKSNLLAESPDFIADSPDDLLAIFS